MSPLRIALFLFALTLVLTILFRENLTLPSEEMKLVVSCFKAVESAERDYKARFGVYANLPELASAFPRLLPECDNSYVLHVSATSAGFIVEISPAKTPSGRESRRLSLYSGVDGSVRVKYGGQPADATAPVLPLEKLRQYNQQ